MKRMVLAVCLASALSVPAVLWADDVGDAPKPAKRQRKDRPKPAKKERKPHMPREIAEMTKACDLSEDQVKQIGAVLETRNQAMKAFQTANAEQLKNLQAEMKKAREAKDQAAMKQAHQASAELMKKRAEIGTKAQQDILAVLTDEQKAKWQEHLAMAPIVRRYQRAKLTDDQTAQIKAAYQKYAEALKGSDRKAKAEAMKKLDEEIRGNILTDEQREAVKPKPRGDKPARPRPQKQPKPQANEE